MGMNMCLFLIDRRLIILFEKNNLSCCAFFHHLDWTKTSFNILRIPIMILAKICRRDVTHARCQRTIKHDRLSKRNNWVNEHVYYVVSDLRHLECSSSCNVSSKIPFVPFPWDAGIEEKKAIKHNETYFVSGEFSYPFHLIDYMMIRK